jgi:hypothetical protein
MYEATMDSTSLRLQAVLMSCSFEDSPLFPHQLGEVVYRFREKFPDWRRSNEGFTLSSNVACADVRLLRGRIDGRRENAQDTPLDQTALAQFGADMRSLMTESLEALHVSVLSDLDLRCRFYLPDASSQPLLEALVATFAKPFSHECLDFMGESVVDFAYNVTFPSRNSLVAYNLIAYVVMSQAELRLTFPRSAAKCGEGGLVVSVGAVCAPGVSTLQLTDLGPFFSALERAFDLAQMVLKRIASA